MIKFGIGDSSLSGLGNIARYSSSYELCALSLRVNRDHSVTLVGFFGSGCGVDDLLTILPNGIVVPEKPTSRGVRMMLPLDRDGYLDLSKGSKGLRMINQLEQLGAYK